MGMLRVIMVAIMVTIVSIRRRFIAMWILFMIRIMMSTMPYHCACAPTGQHTKSPVCAQNQMSTIRAHYSSVGVCVPNSIRAPARPWDVPVATAQDHANHWKLKTVPFLHGLSSTMTIYSCLLMLGCAWSRLQIPGL